MALKKSNSCSTIYLDDSTISQPHLKNTIICVSLAVFYHIVNRKYRGKERLMEIFEERLHPITVCKWANGKWGKKKSWWLFGNFQHEPVPAESFTRDRKLGKDGNTEKVPNLQLSTGKSTASSAPFSMRPSWLPNVPSSRWFTSSGCWTMPRSTCAPRIGAVLC